MATIILPLTTATLLLNENPKRKRLRLQMQAFDVDANNVGHIKIGAGFQPNATTGTPTQGEILVASAFIDEPPAGEKLTQERKGKIWAVSSDANQSILVEEESEI